MTFERRKLIHNDGVEVKGQTALLYKPLNILAVDDVDVSRNHQCRFSLLFRTDRDGVGQEIQVIPLLDLGRPCITGDAQRCNYQNAMALKAIKQKVQKGSQCDRRLAKAHIE